MNCDRLGHCGQGVQAVITTLSAQVTSCALDGTMCTSFTTSTRGFRAFLLTQACALVGVLLTRNARKTRTLHTNFVAQRVIATALTPSCATTGTTVESVTETATLTPRAPVL